MLPSSYQAMAASLQIKPPLSGGARWCWSAPTLSAQVKTKMTSNRPYLIRALYEWITDNGLTPHVVVNAELAQVEVPQQHVQEGQIVLNISPVAVQGLRLGNDWIECSARFGGTPYWLRIPPLAIIAIYARETGQGMVFSETPATPRDDEPPPKPQPDKKPMLKVVK